MNQTTHPIFALVYDWLTRCSPVRRMTDPLREATAGQAFGHVLEVGVGPGLNFPFYCAGQVERVDAIDPDTRMVALARRRVQQAAVPLTLTQASVEALPWAEATFDSVVATLVFCSVAHPAHGFGEIKRVLKPGGSLFLLEHVRSNQVLVAQVQDRLVPVTTRLAGNCHWNRDTLQTLRQAGFEVTDVKQVGGKLQPVLIIQAQRPR